MTETGFGDLLRRHRVAAGLTQEALAERAGLSARGISDLERGARELPRKDTLRLLLQALALAPADRAALVAAARRSPARAPGGEHADRLTGLPVPLTPLIGRETDVAAVSALLKEPAVRLLTLTGPGGTGKTRLALAVAERLASDFRDGVTLVLLASLGDPSLVAAAIAQQLGVREAAGQTLVEALTAHLRDKWMLLVLDNFEHLLPAAPLVTELLGAGRSLTVLVTSRVRLRLSGEREVVVPPLALPSPDSVHGRDELARVPAVQLFVARAQDVKADFALTDENASAVAAICERLDGLPLALELAAARIKILSPVALLARLDRRLPLLTGGPRDLPDRQQTLRNTIAWSHDLLGEQERALFRRLGVFAGGWTLEAVEAVANRDGAVDVFEGLTSLVDNSLVRQSDHPDDEPRFMMLETIREFALERLAHSGEEDVVRERHATHFVTLVERAAIEIRGPAQVRWLDHIEADLDNVRGAFSWLLEHDELEDAARLAVGMIEYWWQRGDIGENRSWLERVLKQAERLPPPLRFRALLYAGGMAKMQGDHGHAFRRGEEALVLAREQDATTDVIEALNAIANVQSAYGDVDRAAELMEEAVALQRQHAGAEPNPHVLETLGVVEYRRHHYDQAAAAFEEALAVYRTAGDRQWIAETLDYLGDVECGRGNVSTGLLRYAEALELWRALKDGWGTADALIGFVDVAALSGQSERAARLLGVAEALYQAAGVALPPHDRPNYERAVTAARASLGDEVFTALRMEGRGLGIGEALAEALVLVDELTTKQF